MDPRQEPIVFRLLRVLLSVWWIFAPVLLGYWGTQAQRQDVVAGLLALPLMLFSLAFGGLRSFFFIIGAWLALSPAYSGFYGAAPSAVTADRVTGILAMLLATIPLLLAPREADPRERLFFRRRIPLNG